MMNIKGENNMSDPNITKIVLDNSVRLIHCKIPTSAFVTIEISVLAGSRNESNDNMGIAHFLEHTMFSGTDKRPNNKIIGFEIESLGGSMNAATSEETTSYYIKIPYENFTKAFEILSDMFLHSNFNSSYLEVEKGVIKEELRMYEDTPQRDIFTLYNELLYKDTPLGRDIGGTIESIDHITREKVLNFIKNNYYLNNIVISIVGNVGREEALDTVTKYFRNDNLGSRSLVNGENNYIKSKFSEDNIKIKKKDVNQTHFILSFRGYPAGDDRQYSLNVLSSILGGGFGAWLFQKLRNEMGVAYYVYSGTAEYMDIGDLHIVAGVDNKRFEESLVTIIKTVSSIKNKNIRKEDIIRAKEYIKGNLSSYFETTDNMASFFADEELRFKKIRSLNDLKSSIDKVSIDSLYDVFNDIKKHIYLACILPDKTSTSNLDDIINHT